MKVRPLQLPDQRRWEPVAGPVAPGRCDSGHDDPRRAGDPQPLQQPLGRWLPSAHRRGRQPGCGDRQAPLHRLAGKHQQHHGVGRVQQLGVLHHDRRPEPVGLWVPEILGGIAWRLAPVNADDRSGLELHADRQREMGSGGGPVVDEPLGLWCRPMRRRCSSTRACALWPAPPAPGAEGRKVQRKGPVHQLRRALWHPPRRPSRSAVRDHRPS